MSIGRFRYVTFVAVHRLGLTEELSRNKCERIRYVVTERASRGVQPDIISSLGCARPLTLGARGVGVWPYGTVLPNAGWLQMCALCVFAKFGRIISFVAPSFRRGDVTGNGPTSLSRRR